MQFLIKTTISALIIVAISEISKRNSLLGGLLASLPVVSVLALFWLYNDTKNIEKVAALSSSIFWMVIPSLPLFLVFPYLLRQDYGFWLSLSLSIILMIICYLITVFLLNRLGVTL